MNISLVELDLVHFHQERLLEESAMLTAASGKSMISRIEALVNRFRMKKDARCACA